MPTFAVEAKEIDVVAVQSVRAFPLTTEIEHAEFSATTASAPGEAPGKPVFVSEKVPSAAVVPDM